MKITKPWTGNAAVIKEKVFDELWIDLVQAKAILSLALQHLPESRETLDAVNALNAVHQILESVNNRLCDSVAIHEITLDPGQPGAQ
jgi:hypothetical protein